MRLRLMDAAYNDAEGLVRATLEYRDRIAEDVPDIDRLAAAVREAHRKLGELPALLSYTHSPDTVVAIVSDSGCIECILGKGVHMLGVVPSRAIGQDVGLLARVLDFRLSNDAFRLSRQDRRVVNLHEDPWLVDAHPLSGGATAMVLIRQTHC